MDPRAIAGIPPWALLCSRVHVITADVQDSSALQNMAARTRVIINAAGPFRLLGLPVVAAAVHRKAHYVDVVCASVAPIMGPPKCFYLCHEKNRICKMHDKIFRVESPCFKSKLRLDTMMLQLKLAFGSSLAAALTASLVRGTTLTTLRLAQDRAARCRCLFPLPPLPTADVGSLLTSRVVAGEGAQPSSVQAFLTVESGPQGFAGHYGTWASLVGGLGAADNLRTLRRQQAAKTGHAKPQRIGTAPKRGSLPFQPTELPGKYGRMWALPFPGADAAMQRRTARLFASPQYQGDDNPVHFHVYFLVPSLFWAAVFVIWGVLIGLLTKSAWGRSVLLRVCDRLQG